MVKSVSTESDTAVEASPGEMRRSITWKNSFWISSGASTLVLLSIGSIAATVGTPSWIVWGASSLIGFIQLFIYAEIASMFPNKSGGASVYGAVAWARYNKLFAPINVWCYWLAWSPALAIGAALAGSYIVTAFFADTAFGKFSVTLLDLSALLPGIKLTFSSNILIGIGILLLSFYIQHTGILRAARTQFVLALLSLIPIALLSLTPLVTGKVSFANFLPLIPQGATSWFSQESFTLIMGGMFIAAWTTYAAETAVCYTSEFKDPGKDSVRAVASSGILAFLCFTLLPFTFLGVLGMKNLSDPAFVAGDPQTAMVKLAEITFGDGSGKIITLMLIFALILAISTSMSGGFLGQLNSHGVPTKAMWADLSFNIFLLMLGSPIFILAASAVAYVLCIAMNMNAGWMHRLQRPDHPRPYRAPDWLIFVGGPILSLLNLAFIVFGANVFAPNALWYGLGAIALVIPIFYYRHYIIDQGQWPAAAQRDLDLVEPLP
jgi:amino acid transporter